MDLNVGKELTALRRMPVRDLQSRYAELFCRSRNRPGRQLTPDAERSAAGRFAFLACRCKGLRRSRRDAGTLRFEQYEPGCESNLGRALINGLQHQEREMAQPPCEAVATQRFSAYPRTGGDWLILRCPGSKMCLSPSPRPVLG